jgi:hypothetical protein
MKITSKSKFLLNDYSSFSLDLYKQPFCYNEPKDFYKYNYPLNLKDKSFWKNLDPFKVNEKILFLSGPGRNGNHLLISLLDNHPELPFSPGEDDFLRTFLCDVNLNEKETLQKIRNKDSNINYMLMSSGQPGFKEIKKDEKRFNKWYHVNKLYNNKDYSFFSDNHSGLQSNGIGHIKDFSDRIPDINYDEFKNSLTKDLLETENYSSFYALFRTYLKNLNLLIDKNKSKKLSYDFIYTGSGLRRELFMLLANSNKIICLTPIRKFETFLPSFIARFGIEKINQEYLNLAWEHWRHKTIDYLKLQQQYPENLFIIKFEDLINKRKEILLKISSIINIKFNENMLEPTFIGENTKGNSSFFNKKRNFFNNNNIILHKEYYDIINYLDEVSI